MEGDETQQETELSSPDPTTALSVHGVMTMKRKQAAKGRNQPWHKPYEEGASSIFIPEFNTGQWHLPSSALASASPGKAGVLLQTQGWPRCEEGWAMCEGQRDQPPAAGGGQGVPLEATILRHLQC